MERETSCLKTMEPV